MKTAIFTSRYNCEYDYNTSYSCSDSGCDGICRCGKISGAVVTSVSIHTGLFEYHEPGKRGKKVFEPSAIDLYCMDRLLRIYKAYEPGNYEPLVSGGYYGEEITGASFSEQSAISEDATELLNLGSDLDKIKFVLNKEYMYVLDVIDSANNVSIETVKLEDITLNEDYLSRLKRDNKNPSYPFEEELPVGILFNRRLIDGYHRYTSLLNENPKIKHKYIVVS